MSAAEFGVRTTGLLTYTAIPYFGVALTAHWRGLLSCALLIGLLATTSVCFHSRRTTLWFWLDQIAVHSVLLHGLWLCLYAPGWSAFIYLLGVAFAAWIYAWGWWKRSMAWHAEDGELWHAGVHFIGIVAWLQLIYAMPLDDMP